MIEDLCDNLTEGFLMNPPNSSFNMDFVRDLTLFVSLISHLGTLIASVAAVDFDFSLRSTLANYKSKSNFLFGFFLINYCAESIKLLRFSTIWSSTTPILLLSLSKSKSIVGYSSTIVIFPSFMRSLPAILESNTKLSEIFIWSFICVFSSLK
jgi:hypothetical protein